MNRPEVFAILVSMILLPIVPILHVFLIRLFGNSGLSVRFMFLTFAIYFLVFAAVFYSRHPGFHTGTLSGIAAVGFWSLVYMESFSMLCRGFSLTILVDLLEKRGLSLSEILESYGGGKGAAWLLQKRLDTIEKVGLICQKEEWIRLQSEKARFLGWFGLTFKRILKMGEGG